MCIRDRYNSDIAIISGGVSVYEVAAVGTPAIVICQNKHEDTNAFEDYGFVIKLGLENQTEQIIKEKIEELIDEYELRKQLSKRSKELVDGNGAERVANLILNSWLGDYNT